MKPIVGLSITDADAEAEIYYALREFGVNVFRFDHGSKSRWTTLTFGWVRERVVCVIDDDPEMLEQATDLGFPAVPWTTHADVRREAAQHLKSWRAKVKAAQ